MAQGLTMPALSKGMLRDIKAILVCVHEGEGTVQASTVYEAMEAINRALTPKRSLAPAAKRRASKAETRKEEMQQLRSAVVERAGDDCEACQLPFREENPGELDHWFGGSGRRLVAQSFETCWLIHHSCHSDRTNNRPDAAYWIRRFTAHCRRHGYETTAVMAERRLR